MKCDIRFILNQKIFKNNHKFINQEFILEIFKFALEHFFFFFTHLWCLKSFDMYDSMRCKCIRNHVGGRSIRYRWRVGWTILKWMEKCKTDFLWFILIFAIPFKLKYICTCICDRMFDNIVFAWYVIV